MNKNYVGYSTSLQSFVASAEKCSFSLLFFLWRVPISCSKCAFAFMLWGTMTKLQYRRKNASSSNSNKNSFVSIAHMSSQRRQRESVRRIECQAEFIRTKRNTGQREPVHIKATPALSFLSDPWHWLSIFYLKYFPSTSPIQKRYGVAEEYFNRL